MREWRMISDDGEFERWHSTRLARQLTGLPQPLQRPVSGSIVTNLKRSSSQKCSNCSFVHCPLFEDLERWPESWLLNERAEKGPIFGQKAEAGSKNSALLRCYLEDYGTFSAFPIALFFLIFKEICLNAAWHGIWFQRSICSLVVWLKSSIIV